MRRAPMHKRIEPAVGRRIVAQQRPCVPGQGVLPVVARDHDQGPATAIGRHLAVDLEGLLRALGIDVPRYGVMVPVGLGYLQCLHGLIFAIISEKLSMGIGLLLVLAIFGAFGTYEFVEWRNGLHSEKQRRSRVRRQTKRRRA